MGFLIGHGRRARESYPEGSAGNAAAGALRNRNVAGDTSLTTPFTPDNTGKGIAAILFTPKVSGVIQVSASIAVANGAGADTYTMGLLVTPGTGLSVTGGEVTVNGWVMGSNTPPVIGGVTGAPLLVLDAIDTIAANKLNSLLVFGISQPPLPIGVPVVIVVFLQEAGVGNALTTLAILNLSVMELP